MAAERGNRLAFHSSLWYAVPVSAMALVSAVVFVPYAVGAIILWRRRCRERDSCHGGSRRAVLED